VSARRHDRATALAPSGAGPETRLGELLLGLLGRALALLVRPLPWFLVPRPVRHHRAIAAACGPADRLRALRIAWGEIRARYRTKHMPVPA